MPTKGETRGEEAPQEASFENALGEIVVELPRGTRWLGWSFAGVFFVILAALSMFRMPEVETVNGRVSPEGGLIRLASPRVGMVQDIAVTEGQRVPAGMPIAFLQSGERVDGTPDELGQQITQTETGGQAGLALLAGERESLRRDLLLAEQQAAEARLRVPTALEAEKIAADRLRRLGPAAREGFVSQDRLSAAKTQHLSASEAASRARSDAAAAEQRLSELRAKLAAIPARAVEMQAENARAVSVLRGAQRESSTTSRLPIIAPRAGTVLALPVNDGQSISQGTTVALLAPDGSQLLAELFVPSRAAGFLRVGQEVRFFYDAFPSQRYGVGRGQIVAFSRSVLSPEEVKALGWDASEPVFRVRASITRPYVAAGAQRYYLRSGMRLSADLVLSEKPLWKWVLEPWR